MCFYNFHTIDRNKPNEVFYNPELYQFKKK